MLRIPELVVCSGWPDARDGRQPHGVRSSKEIRGFVQQFFKGPRLDEAQTPERALGERKPEVSERLNELQGS
jgi:hypothetical protein